MRRWALVIGIVVVALCLLVVPSVRAASDVLEVRADQPELIAQRLRVPLSSGTREVTLWIEPGFEIGVAAWGLPNARMLAQSPTGELVLSQHFEGKVVKLADHNGDGTIDEVTPIMTGLNVPHGLAFVGDSLFIAETDRILRLDTWWDGSSAHPIVALPGGGHHQTRSLTAGPDGRLYVSIGSTCDACAESDPMRAAIWRLDSDGGNLELYASGLRNAVGLTWSPDGGQLWATENERNELGEEQPPDEVVAIRPGGDYGWPYCYGDRVPAPGFGSPERCAATESPTLTLPAHIAPLGLVFLTGSSFPPEDQGDLLVGLHGSALRDQPVGYEVARVPVQDGVPGEPQPFMRGWLVGDDSWGRPVGPFVAHDGTIYLTDDKGGVVYWVRTGAPSRWAP
jgi:glucose/arabinose dehydrogenase